MSTCPMRSPLVMPVLAGAAAMAVARLLRPKTPWYQLVAVGVAAAAAVAVAKRLLRRTTEGFASAGDGGRSVRYGDVVSLWTMRNNYVKVDDAGAVVPSATLTRPEDLPRGSYKELYIVENPADPAGPGSTNPLNYGDKVVLRSFSGSYLAVGAGSAVVTQAARDDPRATFVLEGETITSDLAVSFGDGLYLRSGAAASSTATSASGSGLYLTVGAGGISALARDATSRLVINDRFGQGLNVDWARRGATAQSSTTQNLYPYFAVDGALMTYSSTNSEVAPWWEVTLPNDVYVDRVIVQNRINVASDVQMRLSNFVMILKDAAGVEIARKAILTDSPTSEFSWASVFKIGRTLRVQLADANPQFLALSGVQVFGLPVQNSILLNKPITADLTSSAKGGALTLDASRSRVFEHQELPVVRSSMTLAFWLTLDPKTYASASSAHKALALKGTGGPTDPAGTKAPGIWLAPASPVLRIVASSDQNSNDGIDAASVKLPLGKPVHVAVSVNSGITPAAGWDLGTFTPAGGPSQLFVIYSPLQKRYYVLGAGITPANYKTTFGNVKVTALDDIDGAGFQNLGAFDPALTQPEVRLYVNGRVTDRKALRGAPIFNTSALAFNPDKAVVGSVSDVKFANYAMSDAQVNALAVIKSSSLCKALLAGAADAAKALEFAHSELPAYDSAFTLGFWVSPAPGLPGKQPLVVKGTVEEPEFGVLAIDGSGVSAPIRTAKYPVMEGLPRVDLSLTSDGWTHLALVVADGLVTLYANGAAKAKAALDRELATTYSGLVIGGFAGRLANVQFCNYGMAAADLPQLMGPHPDTAANAALKAMFEKAGCSGWPAGINDDPSGGADLKALLANARSDEVDRRFTAIKQAADAYLAGDTSDDNSTAAQQCFGDLRAFSGITAAAVASCPKAATCLPTAPFTCPPAMEVGSFDIRTHPDFYKYVEAGQVRPPPTLSGTTVDVARLTDPAAVSALLKANPAVAAAIVAEVSGNPALAGQLGNPASAASMTAALRADPALAAQVLSSVVQSTSDPAVVAGLTQAAVASGALPLQDLLKHVPADQTMGLLQAAMASQNVPMSQLLATMKSDDQLTAVVKGLVDAGKVQVSDLASAASDTPSLRSELAAQCANGTIFGTLAP